MILGLFRRKKRDETISTLYGAIVAQARDPAFYRDHGVGDTVTGRFELVSLHVFLLLHRLKEEPEDRRQLGQDLFDLFFLDLDRGLRELGVGDTKVPKRIKEMGQAFYGRVKAYDDALADAEAGALARAIARNVLGDEEADATPIAAYMRAAVAELSSLPFQRFARGEIVFPPVPRRRLQEEGA
ncbi:ubiquinol-cytochrome C chaperone family protein [Phreatobacter sp.]|uniref:ubiquinol-cytochrome C chaperone family protein n=1 Tax=Phreatobacter sp. TaxID=1966341 RepID=UPI003F728377